MLTNPGVWGKRLADFLRKGLGRERIETSEPVPEDWGWALPLSGDAFGIWLGCRRNEEYSDGFVCFIYPRKFSLKRLFQAAAVRERVSAVQQAVDRALSEEFGVYAKSWYTDDEYNER